MTNKSNKTTPARTVAGPPPNLSPAEEAEWWFEHKDYWDQIDFEDEVVGPLEVRKTAPVTLRLPEDLIAALKEEAARQDIAYQTLIRIWLDERLAAERRPA